jgi:O-antigen/teichoic acid export membrane protein
MSLDALETFPASSERTGLAALSRASVIYALGGLAYKGVALVTIPILARLLSPAELGLLDLAAVLSSTIGLIAVLGTDQAVAFHEPRSRAIGELWGAALAIVVAVAVGMLVIVTLAQGPLAAALTGNAGNAPIVVAAGLYGGVVGLTGTGLNAARLRASPGAYAVASFVLVTAEMAVALAVAWLGLGSVALMVLGWAVGAVIVLAVVFIRFLPRPRLPPFQTMRALATYGAPLVPAAVAWLAADALIRGTLAREEEAAVLGEYGIAYRIASILGLAVTGFAVAWYPYLYRSPATEVVPRAARALGLLVLVLATLGVGISALSPEIIAVVAGDAYAGARVAAAPMVGGMVGLGAFLLIGAVVGAAGSTRRIAVTALTGAAVQVVASLLLVPPLGLLGAGLSSLVGYVTAAALLGLTEIRVMVGRAGLANAAVVTLAAGGLAAAAILSGASIGARLMLIVGFIVVAALAGRALGLGRGWTDATG